MAALLEAGNRALAVLERRLENTDWLAGDAFSVADISLYAYTHMAEDGGYDLTGLPAIGRWLQRVSALPDHIPITAA